MKKKNRKRKKNGSKLGDVSAGRVVPGFGSPSSSGQIPLGSSPAQVGARSFPGPERGPSVLGTAVDRGLVSKVHRARVQALGLLLRGILRPIVVLFGRARSGAPHHPSPGGPLEQEAQQRDRHHDDPHVAVVPLRLGAEDLPVPDGGTGSAAGRDEARDEPGGSVGDEGHEGVCATAGLLVKERVGDHESDGGGKRRHETEDEHEEATAKGRDEEPADAGAVPEARGEEVGEDPSGGARDEVEEPRDGGNTSSDGLGAGGGGGGSGREVGMGMGVREERKRKRRVFEFRGRK